jgi:beta-N-acetylhexosaminidase
MRVMGWRMASRGAARGMIGRWGGAAAWRWRLVVALLAGVLLVQAACGQQSIASLNRLDVGGAPGAGAQTLALERQAQAQMAYSRQHLLYLRAANWYLAHLSLDDQIGQMIMNEMDGTVYSPDMAIMVAQQHIGGMIVFGDNYGTLDQTKLLFSNIQQNAPIPLFIATDQEGGGITRISQYYGSFPAPCDLGATNNPQQAYDWGKTTALDLQALGINTNFAPVVDVSVNGGEPWSATRTYNGCIGGTPVDGAKLVATFALASMNGQRSVGEITALKHFPGLGRLANDQDPHVALYPVNVSLDELQQSDLYPYQALIADHPDMVMATDVLDPQVDPVLPGEISPTWITTILRQRMGYQGVIVTDALWMHGLDAWGSLGQRAVLSVEAGCDLMIAAYNSGASQGVIDALKGAVASGQISQERITESVRRILTLKVEYGMLPIPPQVLAGQPLVAA